MQPPDRPRFTLVSAVYGVAGYLGEFIDSIERQTFPLDRVQVVMVDDGSVDGSLDIIRTWAARRPGLVTVLSQPNGGQASARNAGLEHAAGEWVSFPDPDDALSEDYLEHVDRFLRAHREVDLVAANRWIWREATGTITNTHPLRHMFQRDRLVDLSAEGHHFQGSTNAAFFRREDLEAESLRFDTRLRPAFEDGHFATRYLLSFPNPTIGFLRSAQYHYRKRQNGTSTLQVSRTHPGRYDLMLELGFLDVVDRAIKQRGSVPSWLQAYLVYELSWYFTLTDTRAPLGLPTSGPDADRAHVLIQEALAHVDPHVVEHSMVRLQRTVRYVLLHGYAPRSWHEPFVLLTKLDRDQQVVQATYFFTGEPPVEEVRLDGSPTQPLHAKSVDYTFLGRTLLRRRILWLPAAASVAIRLDGRDMDLVFRRPDFPVDTATPAAMRHHIKEQRGRAVPSAEPETTAPHAWARRQVRELLGRRAPDRRYARAWVLMDRVDSAADSAEILFKHLRTHHADVNAWFVLAPGSPDWRRLRSEGYGDRLVAHGSTAWRLLMANALHLVSSQAAPEIVQPPELPQETRPSWRFHLLGDGVVQDDVSGRLNRLPIETVVTSTFAEHAAIAGDSPYTLSTREAHLTGLPRFDRLLEVGRRFGPERRDLLVVAPIATTVTELARWGPFLESSDLRAAAERRGARVACLLRPGLAPVLRRSDLPDHVVLLSHDGDVQEHLARALAFVTDSSPYAFDAAYLHRPVVYHRPGDEDATDAVGPSHTDTRGSYFDAHRDGFGPVTVAPHAAVAATVAALDGGPVPAAPYLIRMEATFPRRDGQCSERAFRAIRRSTRDRSRDTSHPTPMPPATA